LVSGDQPPQVATLVLAQRDRLRRCGKRCARWESDGAGHAGQLLELCGCQVSGRTERHL
jgi:hypothetical protein